MLSYVEKFSSSKKKHVNGFRLFNLNDLRVVSAAPVTWDRRVEPPIGQPYLATLGTGKKDKKNDIVAVFLFLFI